MNFLTLFATSVASFALVIGRRFTLEFVIGICGKGEIDGGLNGFRRFHL